MIIANPIYDSVFKFLMADLEAARGIISGLIGMRVLELKVEPQEFVRKDSATGNLNGLRLDFHALIETEERGRFNVIIELQKAQVGTNALRFRHYLGNQYQSVSEIERGSSQSLPIISIYLLGYNLDTCLPMVTHVERQYRDAVSQQMVKTDKQNEFIELLTHDAYFIQIPMIESSMATELERVLSVFDQHQKLENDGHRLEVDAKSVHSYPLIKRIYRILNQAQENPKIEQAMNLEDLFLLEQQDAAQLERKQRLKLEVELDESETKLSEAKAELGEARAKADEAKAKADEAKTKADEETEKRHQADSRCEEAEQEIKRLKKLLEDSDS